MRAFFSQVNSARVLPVRLWKSHSVRRPTKTDLAIPILASVHKLDAQLKKTVNFFDSDFLLKVSQLVKAFKDTKPPTKGDASASEYRETDLRRFILGRSNGWIVEEMIQLTNVLMFLKLPCMGIYELIFIKVVKEKPFHAVQSLAHFMGIWKQLIKVKFFVKKGKIKKKTLNSTEKSQKEYLKSFFENFLQEIVNEKSYLTELHLDLIGILFELVNPVQSVKLFEKLETKKQENLIEQFKVELYERLSYGEGHVNRDLVIIDQFLDVHAFPGDSEAPKTVRAILERNDFADLEDPKIRNLVCEIFKKSAGCDPIVMQRLLEHVNASDLKLLSFEFISSLITVHVFANIAKDYPTETRHLLKLFSQKLGTTHSYVRYRNALVAKNNSELHISLEILYQQPEFRDLFTPKIIRFLHRMTESCYYKRQMLTRKFSKTMFQSLRRKHDNKFSYRNGTLLQARHIRDNLFEKSTIYEEIGKILETKLTENGPVRVNWKVKTCQFEVPIYVYFEEVRVDVLVLFPASVDSKVEICRSREVRKTHLGYMGGLIVEVGETEELKRAFRQENTGTIAEIVAKAIRDDLRVSEMLEERENAVVQEAFFSDRV